MAIYVQFIWLQISLIGTLMVFIWAGEQQIEGRRKFIDKTASSTQTTVYWNNADLAHYIGH